VGQFEGRQGFGESPGGHFLSEEVDQILADPGAHLIRLGFLGGLFGYIGKDDCLDLPGIDWEIGHADSFQGTAAHHGDRICAPQINIVQPFHGQGPVEVDLHNDLGGGFDPFRCIIDRCRGNDLTFRGQAHRLDYRHIQSAEPSSFDLQRQ